MTASLIFGIGGAVDLLFSYPAGLLMDRYGRRVVAVPSLLVIGVAFLALPFADDRVSLAAVAVVLGIGNGLGNGVIMTVGAVAAVSLAGGAVTVGVLSLLGAVCMFRFIPRYSAVPLRQFDPAAEPVTTR